MFTMSIVMLMLSSFGFALIIAGFTIQLRNRSPYSGTQMDQVAKKRVGVGLFLLTLGSLCIGTAQLIRFWR